MGSGLLRLVPERHQTVLARSVKWLGDPEFVKVPTDQMLSREAAMQRASEIRNPTTQPATRPSIPAGEHTVNIVATDSEGNCVSYTATHGDGFGAKIAIKGLGLILGHGMSRFTYATTSPNAPQGGKRMQHNMSPTIALNSGKPRFVVGLPGGPRIVTVTAQLLASLIDFHATAQQAARRPAFMSRPTNPASFPATSRTELNRISNPKGTKPSAFPSLAAMRGSSRSIPTMVPWTRLRASDLRVSRIESHWRTLTLDACSQSFTFPSQSTAMEFATTADRLSGRADNSCDGSSRSAREHVPILL